MEKLTSIVELLLDNEADPNMVDCFGVSFNIFIGLPFS